MSTADKNSTGDGHEMQVAEYVLGVLDANDHEDMARRIAADPILQAEARFWQSQFSSLDESFEEVAAPGATFGKIQTRLFGNKAQTNPVAALWQNMIFWRSLAAGGLAVAALAIGLALMQPMPDSGVGEPTQLVATLETADSNVKFMAFYDPARSSVRLAALSGEKVPGRDYELWFIEGGNAPVSLGIVPVDGKIEVPLTDKMLRTISEGTVLAVTLEPLGGAPGGIVSGPIVAVGSIAPV